jgi:hypothetical protein
VRVVALDRDVLEVEAVDHGDRRVEAQRRQRPGLAGQLQLRLLEVVEVEVRVAQGVHEVTDLEAGHLRDHVGEQGVGGDVEGHAQEHVGRALVELAAEPATRGRGGHVELEHRVARRQRHVRHVSDVPGRDDQTP